MYVNAYSPQYLSAFRPTGYGKVAPANGAAQAPRVYSHLERPADKDVHRIFAQEAVRRLDLNAFRAQDDADGKGGDESKHLQLSLAKAIGQVENNFGHDAGVAVMGIFMSAIGDGGVGEEAVGGAMLDAVRFMDRNFGFAAGDKLMGAFNRDLNKRVNEYFDNGLNEQLYDKAQLTNQVGRAVSQVTGAVLEKFGQDDADAVKAILEAALNDADTGLGRALRDGMRDAAAYLEDKYDLDDMADLAQGMAESVYGQAATPPPPGAILDVAV